MTKNTHNYLSTKFTKKTKTYILSHTFYSASKFFRIRGNFPHVTSPVRPAISNLSTTSTVSSNSTVPHVTSPVRPAVSKLSTTMNEEVNSSRYYERMKFTVPTNSEDEGLDGDDEAEDNNNNSAVNATQDAIVLELPTNSEDERQDEDVDQSITQLMEKQQQMYVIRQFVV